MRILTKTLLATAMAAVVGLGANPVMARGGEACDGSGPHAMRQGMDPAAMQERIERRLERLQEALALQPSQGAAWATFKEAMLERAQGAAERMRERRDQDRPVTAPERMERMERFGKERVAALGVTRQAVETFYAQLTDAQKKTFDERFRLMGPGDRGHHGKGHRGHGAMS